MNLPKPDTFVLVVAAMSEKLVQKENECADLRSALFVAQEDLSDIRAQQDQRYDELDELRVSNQNLSDDKYRLQNQVYDLQNKVRNQDYIEAENARMKEELLRLKYGAGDAHQRVRNYMLNEGGKLWAEGKKIECIKGAKGVTGWGLKETKDFCEEWGPSYSPDAEETPSGTKRSQDLARTA